MGTRHLIMVVKDNKTVVAQYAQWDGYPDGAGVGVLQFLKGTDLTKFADALDNCRFGDDDEIEVIWNDPACRAFLSRDAGAGILAMISQATDKVILQDNSEFANDGLMCEWAYVLDMDNSTLEVYEGFNTTGVLKSNRFQGEGRANFDGSTTYYPVSLKGKFPFDDLPTSKEFCNALSDDDDIAEDEFTEDEIFTVIDHIRSGNHGNDLITDRICNYMNANVDSFMECYED